MNNRFGNDWLALREPADAQARDRRLVIRARDWMAERPRPLYICDLGAGSGANPRFLAGELPGPQRWRLIDHDPELLDRAAARLAGTRDETGSPIRFTTCRLDLSDIDIAITEHTDLATASALFDLVSADWITALAARCAEVGCAALWTLSVDGNWYFTGVDGRRVQDRTDAAMLEMLQAHQAREKGLGRALGGAAPEVLRAAFARHRYSVDQAPSVWRLRAGRQQPLAIALLAGWRDALLEQAPDEEKTIRAWWCDRRSAIETGRLGIEVSHVDLYAEPPH